MINCNPETVSTDYDTSDRLYFEPLTREDVLGVLAAEQAASVDGGRVAGVIVSLGGQTPLKLAHDIDPTLVLGTSPASIDLAEDRQQFNDLLAANDMAQPPGGTATTLAGAKAVAAEVGYPVLVRPSYVLGGRAMEIVYDDAGLSRAMTTLLGGKEGITRARGSWREYRLPDGRAIPALPLFHPAYLLRQPAHKRLAWADLRRLRAAIDRGSPG